MLKLTLFSGSECCLCDLAKALLDDVENEIDYKLTTIDVKAQREYFHQYGARIPVLHRPDNGQELGWPFNKSQLIEFLA